MNTCALSTSLSWRRARKDRKDPRTGKADGPRTYRLLLDADTFSQEIGLLVAYDEYNGQAPAAAVVTVVGKINGRESVVVANDATIKAGAWYPGNDQKDTPRTGDRDAEPRTDRLSCRFGWS